MPARPSPDVLVARRAARHHGLITRAEALAAGLTAAQIRHRVRSGLWERVSHGVYRIAGAPTSPEQVALAAILSTGDGALASHLTALALFGIGNAPSVPHLTVGPAASARTRTAVVHRSEVAVVDRTKVGVIPCTSPARSLVDVAALVDRRHIAELVDDVVCAGLVQPASVLGAARRAQRAPGRRGVPMLIAALGPWVDGIRPGSPAEVRLLRRLVAWGLPVPAKQHRVHDDTGELVGVLDLAWSDRRIGLEYDGVRHHTPRDLGHDVAREERLRSLGWSIERVDRFDLVPSSTRLRDLLAPLLVRAAA